MNDTFAPNTDEYEVIKKIAKSSNDGPVLMININKYLPNAGYPDGKFYKDYMKALYVLLEQLGARILWHIPVLGQPVGARIPVIKTFWRLGNSRDQMKVSAVVI